MNYIDPKIISDALKLLSSSAECQKIFEQFFKELEMPNIPMPTMGGHFWWQTLCEYNGWKLQQNSFTHHARILDSNDRRIAWGSLGGMEKALDRLVNYAKRYQ